MFKKTIKKIVDAVVNAVVDAVKILLNSRCGDLKTEMADNLSLVLAELNVIKQALDQRDEELQQLRSEHTDLLLKIEAQQSQNAEEIRMLTEKVDLLEKQLASGMDETIESIDNPNTEDSDLTDNFERVEEDVLQDVVDDSVEKENTEAGELQNTESTDDEASDMFSVRCDGITCEDVYLKDSYESSPEQVEENCDKRLCSVV